MCPWASTACAPTRPVSVKIRLATSLQSFSHMAANRMLVSLASLLCALLLTPAAASAVTIDQIIAMSKAGVPAAAIVALIERDRTVFAVDAAQLVELQQAGVPEAVTVAMIRSSEAQEPSNAVAPEQTTVVTEPPPAFVTYGVPYAIPYAVPARVHVRGSRTLVAPPNAQIVPSFNAQTTVTSARGMFFSQPATGIFFPQPSSANCPAPTASPHPR